MSSFERYEWVTGSSEELCVRQFSVEELREGVLGTITAVGRLQGELKAWDVYCLSEDWTERDYEDLSELRSLLDKEYRCLHAFIVKLTKVVGPVMAMVGGGRVPFFVDSIGLVALHRTDLILDRLRARVSECRPPSEELLRKLGVGC